ncbi:hypothetical protein DFH07DRAFT_855939 [Mycena maculata]|uniref:F-box/LRR-repeat protein 15/At3g58940/PEG3-like LRR domain-containing protein n=1 Tax=Mycena maculata TaxID=230809 RepID=A0AAD7HMF4_9AGAR|nr:hypothetical protein DFH07DRAFT_855939 [Mycena maculata]
MELPQELIDGIIDEIRDSPQSLGCCALVAHSFLHQSQMHLFAEIETTSPSSSRRFSELLSASPHLALYVRGLTLHCSRDNWRSAAHILSAVSRLTQLKLTPLRGFQDPFPREPTPLHGSFSFQSLRSLELCNYDFYDVFELEALVSDCPKLESLVLQDIVFSNHPLSPAAAVREGATVVVPDLTLRDMTLATIDTIMAAFTAVDLKQLLSLSVYHAPFSNTLRLNVNSVRSLHIRSFFHPVRFENLPAEPDFPPAVALEYLYLEVNVPPDVLRLLAIFGDLGRLTKLTSIAVLIASSNQNRIHDWSTWRGFDALLRVLAEAGTLKAVSLRIAERSPAMLTILRSCMPSLQRASVLTITS